MTATAWWIVTGAAMLALALLGLAFWRRAAHYRSLAAALETTAGRAASHFELSAHPFPDFSRRIATVANFLTPAQLLDLRSEVENLAAVERSYVPTHKKGGTIAYATLVTRAPAVTRLYHSEALARFVSRVVGAEVRPTPLHDQSSLSVLIYDHPGDHIDWHYDHNFYRGRHFTVLLPVVNAGRAEGGLSHARLFARLDGADIGFATPPNTLVLFEGAKVLHKASPIETGERRIVISMTFCADNRATFAQTIARRIKDTAFFGVRALWT